MSTFNGEIKEIPGISVDNFEKCESRAYFLSHCHFDHTYGLYENSFLTYLIRKRYYVYTSTHTARIIAHRKPALKNQLKGLNLGAEIIYVPGDAERAIEDKYVTVTLIPAGHCFGSVMFLFETRESTVLFTGDFRIMEDDLHKYKDFHDENGQVINIDTVYVDTEFQSWEYPDFPTRSESVDYAILEIKKWLRKSERRRVALHVSAEYGYEYIFNRIYKELGMKVYVNDISWEFYSQVQNLVPGITNDATSRIHLCSNRHETDSHEKCMKSDKEHDRNAENVVKNNSNVENIQRKLFTNELSNQSSSTNGDLDKSTSEKPFISDNIARNLSTSDNLTTNLCASDTIDKTLSASDNMTTRISTSDNVTKNIFTSENVSKNVPTSENVTKNLSASDNITKTLSTSDNVTKNISSDNLCTNLSTSDNLAINLSTSDNVTKNLCSSDNVAKNLSTSDNLARNLSTNDNVTENLSIGDNLNTNVSKSDDFARNLSKSDNLSRNLSTSDNSAKIQRKPVQTAKELKKAYLYMHFSARKWKNYTEGDKMFNTDYVANRTDVCFSTHCSRNELIYFVNYLSPKNVVGFRDEYIGPVNARISY